MLSPLDFLSDLANPSLGFLPRALVISIIVAAVCGVVGTHVVLRGMAFIGDAVAHAVFPGLAIAFALQVSILLGGAVAGAAVALLVAVFSQRRRVKEDTVIGIFFAASFALGLVIIARVQGYTASLTSVLFGSITGVSEADIVVAAAVGAFVVTLLLALSPQLTAVALDRETAKAMNLPVLLLDVLLYLAVTAAVVISIRTIGNILVLALLITPAATARLITNRLNSMMALSALVGVAGSIIGLYLSWSLDAPTGATIVLTLTAVFLLTWVISPLRYRSKVSA